MIQKPVPPGGDLAQQLTDAVQNVSGVTAVYRSASAIANAVSTVVELATQAPGTAPLVLIETVSDGGLSVSVTIAVSDGQAAPLVAHMVRDAISEGLATHGIPGPFTIRVVVGSVAA